LIEKKASAPIRAAARNSGSQHRHEIAAAFNQCNWFARAGASAKRFGAASA